MLLLLFYTGDRGMDARDVCLFIGMYGLGITIEMKDIIGDGICGFYSLSCHRGNELIAFVIDCVTVIR